MYCFRRFSTDSQLATTQNGIRNAESTTNSMEMPSMPRW